MLPPPEARAVSRITPRTLTAFALLCCVLLTGCQHGREQQAHKAKDQLDEADLLTEVRKLKQADEAAQQALDILQPLRESEPSNVDFRLLEIRAYMTQFISRNIVVMESAPPLPRSWVRLPEVSQYKDYQETAGRAFELLKDVLNGDTELTREQRGYVHGTLASIFRLDKQTADQAIDQYEQAIEAYQEWANDLKSKETKVGSQSLNITRLNNQITGLRMAQAEVNLLLERWEYALEDLKLAMAGDDLAYFSVQFQMLDQFIAQMQHKVDSDQRMIKDPRVEKMQEALRNRTKGKLSNREKVAQYDPNKAALIQGQIDLANTQNNLIYRIICLHQLGRHENEQQARTILRTYYPELDNMLEQRFSH